MLSDYPNEDPSNPIGQEEDIVGIFTKYEEKDNFENNGHMCLHMYGHDRQSNSILIRIDNFRIYCCLELPKYKLRQIPSPDGDFKKATYVAEEYITWDEDLAKKVFFSICEKQNKTTNWKTKESKEAPFEYYFNYFKGIYNYSKNRDPYIYLFFHNLQGRYDLLQTLKFPIYIKGEGYMQFEMHENKISTFRRLLSKQNFQYSSWITCRGRKVPNDVNNKNRISRTYMTEYIVRYSTIKQIPDEISSSWFVYPKILSWDGEMYSKNHKQMPNSKRPFDSLYLIGLTFQYMEHPETRRKIILCYGECNDIPGVEVLCFKTEKELLLAFVQLFHYFCPDILLGYNTVLFDIPYLIGRFEKNEIIVENIPLFGRLLRGKTSINELNWSSSGAGKNSMMLINFDGIIDIDMLPNIRRLYKLRQYTLEFVSQTYLKEGKHDIKAKDMFLIYEDNRAENKGVMCKDHNGEMVLRTFTDVAAYCVQDTVLPIKLFDNRKIWYHLTSLSKAAGVSVLELFTRGEQIRCYSNISYECYKRSMVLSNPQYFDYYFKGGFVGKPKPGVYKYVFTLDFASLYPSIMRAYNISIDAIIKIEDWPNFSPDEYIAEYFEQEEPFDFVSSSYRKDLEDKYKILIKGNQWVEEYKLFKSGIPGRLQTVQQYEEIIKRHQVIFTEDDYKTMCEMGMKEAKRFVINIEDPDEKIKYDPDYFENEEDFQNGGLYGGLRSLKRRYEIRIIKKNFYEGIMSTLESGWFIKRKEIKKLMKKCEDKLKKGYDKDIESERTVHNAGQNAVKIMMNSGYGFNGVAKGMLPALPVAILVTAIGRRLIGIVNEILCEKFKHYGAIVVYNDTDSSMIALNITEEQVLSGEVDLEAIMKEMEDTVNGRPEKIFYNDDATIKETIVTEVKLPENYVLKPLNKIYKEDKHQIKKIVETYEDKERIKVKETTYFNKDGSIREVTKEYFELANLIIKELSLEKKIYSISKYLSETFIEEIKDDLLIKTHIIYNNDHTVNKIIPDIEPVFREELQMECENCCQMCPLKPKYYIKLHREVNLDKIKKNGPFKKDYDGKYEITTKGILTAKKGNSEYANIVYDTLVNQVIFMKPCVDMLRSLTRNVVKFLNDEFSIKDLCRVTELGSDYANPGYFMNVFANYLVSKGMPVKAGDRLEYIIVRTKEEIENRIEQNVGYKCREYSMWEADPERESIDYVYYIEKGLQEQFDYLFKVGNMEIIKDPRLQICSYHPQYSYKRNGELEVGHSKRKVVHFSEPILMISSLVQDYMRLSDQEFAYIYQSMGKIYDPKIPRNRYIATLVDTFMNRICLYIQQFYPGTSI